MANQHYDLIVAGDAPGAQIAGILLGRKGMRILHLHGQGWPRPLLWNAPELLTDLLDTLQARHCLTPAIPLQVYSENSCIEIHGALPWQEELRRELPQDFTEAQKSLSQLEHWGKALQQCFTAIGGSPSASLGHKTAWKLTTLRVRLPHRQLRNNLSSWLDNQNLSAAGHRLLETLFNAVCLTPADKISLAEASLVWQQLLRPQTVAGGVLEKLLHQRLSDTGAALHPFSQLSAIQQLRSGLVQCQLGKNSVTGEHLFLAASPATKIPGWPLSGLGPAGPATWKLDQLSQTPSRLLAPRLLLNSPAGPCQVAIGQQQGQAEVYVRCPSDMAPSNWALKQAFLPGEFKSQCLHTGGQVQTATGPCGERGPIRVKKRIYLGCAERIYPNLGLCGEALTALTLSSLAGKGRKD